MTIKQLIEQLQKFPQETEVYLATDPEGNEVREIWQPCTYEMEKSNNDGTYDTCVIFPNDEIADRLY